MTKILFDCDGTLAEFHQDGQYRDPGYFLNLGPHMNMIGALELLFRTPGLDVRVITSIPDKHPSAIEEKSEWFHRWLPFLPDDNIIFSKCGQGKEAFVDDASECLLVDDYGENIKSWPGKYVKVSRDATDMQYELNRHSVCINPDMSPVDIALAVIYASLM